MLLTEATENAATKPLLESWEANERMRHLPPLEWIVRKFDGDLRPRLDLLYGSFAALAADDPRRPAIEEQLRAVCRAIDRFAEATRHTNRNHAPAALGERIQWAIQHAVSNLNSLDPNLFGRRYPVQTHERSRAEPVYAALLTVICQIERLTKLVRDVDTDIDERLLAGLVTLETPLRREPIA